MATFNLGLVYHDGEIVKQDLSKAYLYFIKAAEFDLKQAVFQLGVCLLYGYGCEKNVDKAIAQFKRDIDLGSSDCAYNLAILYLHEEFNIKEDKKLTWKYLNQTAKMGSKKAQELLK